MNNKEIEYLRKKLLYQSQNRGCRETDILIGNFAQRFISTMNLEQLQDLEQILQQNDYDLYNWLSSKTSLPHELKSPIMLLLLDFVNNKSI